MQLYRLKIQLFRSNPPVNLPSDLFQNLPHNLGPDHIAQSQSKQQSNRRSSHTKSRSQRQSTNLDSHPKIPPTPLPSKAEASTARNLTGKEQNFKVLQPYHKKRPDFRLGKITIEWIDNKLQSMSQNQKGYAAAARGEESASTSTAATSTTVADVQSPPLGTITTVKGESDFNYGIIHLYKDNGGTLVSKSSGKDTVAEESTSAQADLLSHVTEIDSYDGTLVCVLAVPTFMSATDFLKFTAPVNQCVSHYRIIR
jgi:hypothetical protein